MANKPDRFVKVWDAAGAERKVRPVDAREIVEAGGSSEGPLPQAAPVAETIVAETIVAVDGEPDGLGVVEVPVFKSADSGEFVSEEFAESNPKTTYKTKKGK
jgi:hypothetical protein